MSQASDEWTARQMHELGTRHAEIEARGDLEGTLATLVPDPVYEFWPMGWTMTGMDQVRRYYEHLMGWFVPHTRGYTLIEEWVTRTSVAQEYSIDVEVDTGLVETHRVIGVLFCDGRTPLLGGERVFASERCARLMAGDALVDEISGVAHRA